MKKLFVGILAAALCLLSCEKEEERVDMSLSQSRAEVSAFGEVVSVGVVNPLGGTVSARPEPSARSWMSVEEKDGIFSITVTENEQTVARSGKVFFSAAGCKTANIVVNQEAAEGEKHINVSSTYFAVKPEGGSFSLTVSAYPAAEAKVIEGGDFLGFTPVSDTKFDCVVPPFESADPAATRVARIEFDNKVFKPVTVTIVQYATIIERKSLVTKVTGAWCGYCPFMSFSIEKAMEDMPGKLVPMYIYSGDGAVLDTPGGSPFINRYDIKSYPTGVVDYRAMVNNNLDPESGKKPFENLALEATQNLLAATGLSLSVNVSGGKLNADIEVNSLVNEDMKYVVAVLQDGIVYKQSFYGNASDYPDVNFSKYVHDHVTRHFFTSALGDSFTATKAQPYTKSFSVNMNSAWVADNMSVVLYVLRNTPENTTRNVRGVIYTNVTGTYVDNVIVCKAGESVKFKF